MLLILLLSSTVFANIFNVVYIDHIDGDTIIFKHKNEQLICQLDGVDAPELHTNRKLIRDAKKAHVNFDDFQKIGMKSYFYLRQTFLKDTTYKLDVKGNKKDKVKKCLVYLPGQRYSLNERILFDGYALIDKKSDILKYPDVKKRFISAQQAAEVDQEGLWKTHYKTFYQLSR